jgi:hypothetical protein
MEIVFFTSTIIILMFLMAGGVSAHCPLCVAGAGAGLGLSRYLGINDAITGVWIAAFTGAIAFWSANILKVKIPAKHTLVYGGLLGLTLASFYQFKLIDTYAGYIMGLPNLAFGFVAGGLLFYLTDKANYLIKVKKGKSLFPYQSIIFNLGALAILSVLIYIFLLYWI